MENLSPYFEILDLRPGATREQINQSYRDLVNVWHPDRFEHNQRLKEKVTEKLKLINVAYDRLKNFKQFAQISESETCQDTAKPNKDSARKTNWIWPDLSKFTRRLLPSIRQSLVVIILVALLALFITGHITVKKIGEMIGKIIISAMYVVAYFVSLFRQKPAGKRYSPDKSRGLL